jgi:hypothetical protein
MTNPRLLALSDLHVAHPQNRGITAALHPTADGDWPRRIRQLSHLAG